MTTGFAAAQVIIIHCWQVIMNQRIGVNQLYRECNGIDLGGRESTRLSGGVDQARAQAFAAWKKAVVGGIQ